MSRFTHPTTYPLRPNDTFLFYRQRIINYKYTTTFLSSLTRINEKTPTIKKYINVDTAAGGTRLGYRTEII